MNTHNQSTIKAAIIIILIAGIFGALSVFAGGLDPSTAKIGSVCFLLLIFGITATTGIVVTGNPALKTLGNAAIICSAAGFLLFSIMILAETGDVELLKFAVCLLIASLGLGHICFLYHINPQNKYAYNARIGATIAVSLFTLIALVQVFQPLPSIYMMAYNPSTLKMLTALLILELAATLLVPLCNRLIVPTQLPELEFTREPPVEPTPPVQKEEQLPVE